MHTEITEHSGWVLYDAHCGLCADTARRFRPLLARRHLELLPLQTPWVTARLRMPDSELLTEMRLLRTDGRFFGGADALLEIARHFWWTWPLWLIGRFSPLRSVLRAGYRFLARHRNCAIAVRQASGPPAKAASSRKSAKCFPDLLPLLIFPAATLFLKDIVAPWIFMWAMAVALYAGCKWLSYQAARRHGIIPCPARALAYFLAWPGMDAADFLDARNVPAKPRAMDWLLALAKMSGGFVLVWGIARLVFPVSPLLAGWTGMTGVVFILHFGLFHLLSLFWQHSGIKATPLMQNPIAARSLAEFWGRRWNTAFHQLAFRFTFRPFLRFTTPTVALLLVFGLSGLIHDLVISTPASGGYGWPTLYFLIQGTGVVVERSRLGRHLGLGRGAHGWLFTAFVAVGPMCWLFHPPFINHVILPMLTAIGAI